MITNSLVFVEFFRKAVKGVYLRLRSRVSRLPEMYNASGDDRTGQGMAWHDRRSQQWRYYDVGLDYLSTNLTSRRLTPK